MSKSRRDRLVIFLSCTCLLVFFQNCDFQTSSSASMSSVAPGISIVAPTSSTGDSSSPGVGGPDQGGTIPVLAERYYISSLFTTVFGPAFQTTDTTGTITNASDHGTPCSIYEDYSAFDIPSGKYVAADPLASCNITSQSLINGAMNPAASVTRQAQLTHACSDLTSNDTTFNYALAQVGAGVPAVTEANMLKAAQLFYRTRPDVAMGAVQAMMAGFPNPAAPTADDWRSTLFILCSSSYWQVL